MTHRRKSKGNEAATSRGKSVRVKVEVESISERQERRLTTGVKWDLSIRRRN